MRLSSSARPVSYDGGTAANEPSPRNDRLELHLLELRRLIDRSEKLRVENLQVMADIDQALAKIKQIVPPEQSPEE